ncbi:hypothetical protein PM082_005854 [Marasmius tenuissimus]|nr:hypothetical protein PM082_005854 [Marasmius tenuissimus]
MTIEFKPLALPSSADLARLGDFGREVIGIHPAQATEEQFAELQKALYQFNALLFRNIDLTPEEQFAFVKAFDPGAGIFGHGTKKMQEIKGSILSGYLNSLPRVPQVQAIGHGSIAEHEGMHELRLNHGHHSSIHKTRILQEDEEKGYTRFFRWHMDAALYEFSPPRVTGLYAIKIPDGPKQTVRYDDGSGDELLVPLGTTAFESGQNTFDILPPELKSVAVRAKAKYAPKPYEWMSTARFKSTGMGLETEGLEKGPDQLSTWKEEDIKILPFCWKNSVTGKLHMMVHPAAVQEVIVDPVFDEGKKGALYPHGAHLKDLQEVRDLLWKMQRPGIAPSLVYPHDWKEKDLLLWNNRGVMHSVVGHFKRGQVRLLHQCNLAASDDPVGPSDEDRALWE